MRRHLGFKLHETGKEFLEFVAVHGTAPRVRHYPSVGARLGATTTTHPTGALGSAPQFRARICAVSQRDRSPHRDSGTRPLALSAEAGTTVSVLGCRDSSACCAPRSRCPAAMNAGSCARGSTTVCSGS